jgi:hypothetical protein
MRIYSYLAQSLLILSVLGCAAPATKLGSANAQYPAWVLNPDKPGFESVVGSAPVQDWGGRAAQYRVAEMQARKQLAQMLRVNVKSTNRLHEELRAGKFSSEADIETQVSTKVELSLESARVIEEWVDPQDGILYIWMVTSK